MNARPFLLLLVAAALSACGGERLVIEAVQQGRSPTTSHGFVHEHWLQVDLRTLREREGLDGPRFTQGDDWDRQLELCRWTRAQFSPGVPDPYPRANGLAILDAIRSGETGGFCGQYGYLFADALKSVGYFEVRYIELASAAGRTHSTTEVWSDRWQKWVELDAYANAYHTAGSDVPLSTLEIHELLIAGRAGEIVSHVLGDQEDLPESEVLIELHHRFAVSLRNDLADAATPPTIADRHASYLLHVCEDSPEPEAQTFLHVSGRREDFESPRNQTFLSCEPATAGEGGFDCRISTQGTVAHLGKLLVSEDGETWAETDGFHRWSPTDGDALSAIAVNDFGRMARPATVRALRR